MSETVEHLIDLKRHLNSIEHMIYVSCKFTRTTEMLRKVMETIVTGYEQFFIVAFRVLADEDTKMQYTTMNHKIHHLSEILASRGIQVDLTEYFLLKKLLMSDFDSIGEYRKNLCMVSYIDDQEYVINMSRLLEFYNSLKNACGSLNTMVA